MKRMNKKYTKFLIIWAANSLVVFLANWFYPTNVVIGTYRTSFVLAVALTGLLITLFCRGASVFLKKYVQKYLKGRYGMFVFYWVVNAATVWIIARIAPISGFGISSYFWALILGFGLSLGQWLVRQGFKSTKLL